MKTNTIGIAVLALSSILYASDNSEEGEFVGDWTRTFSPDGIPITHTPKAIHIGSTAQGPEFELVIGHASTLLKVNSTEERFTEQLREVGYIF